jgi:hypothetical protein
MTQLQKEMISAAKIKWGKITPCIRKTWNSSFTVTDNVVCFWFNTTDHSTHTLRCKLSEKSFFQQIWYNFKREKNGKEQEKAIN